MLATLKDPEDSEELHRVCSQIRKIMREAEDLAEDIGNSYDELAKMTGQNEPYVAVRSSATLKTCQTLHSPGNKTLTLTLEAARTLSARSKTATLPCLLTGQPTTGSSRSSRKRRWLCQPLSK